MDTELSPSHLPVLAEEVVDYLSPVNGGRYIDGTIGCGGHSLALLKSNESILILGIDRDPDGIHVARKRLAKFNDRICIRQGNYSSMKTFANEKGWKTVNGILLDLGVSSLQLEKPSRGFSFQQDSPLDMRMDPKEDITAFDLLNRLPEKDLIRLFRNYGEESKSRKIAGAVVSARRLRPLSTTQDFVHVIRGAASIRHQGYSSIIARCFQAIRIAVNQELHHLEKGLDAAINLLDSEGRIEVISFHSLEDRMVKKKFRFEAASCVCPPGLPICQCGKKARMRIITKKPVTAGKEERLRNSRSRSAKLRVAEKI